jgi:hypothetical protein
VSPPALLGARDHLNVCLDPGFDLRTRLTFLKWRNELNPGPEWAMRLRHGRAVRLFLLSSDQSGYFTASIAVAREGNAVLLQGGRQAVEIWRWSGGRSQLLIRSTQPSRWWSPFRCGYEAAGQGSASQAE